MKPFQNLTQKTKQFNGSDEKNKSSAPLHREWVDVETNSDVPIKKGSVKSQTHQSTPRQPPPTKGSGGGKRGTKPRVKIASKNSCNLMIGHIRRHFRNGDDEAEVTYENPKELKRKGLQEPDTAPSMLVDQNQIYRFRLTSFHNYTSSAGGVVNTVLDNDPSTTGEYSSLTALFSLVRLRRAQYRIARVVATAIPTAVSVGAFRPLLVAALMDNAGAPGSYDQIMDSSSVVMYNYAFDTSPHCMKTHMDFTGAQTPLWADTSVPASSTTYVGCPGCLQIYGESMPVSTEVLWIMRELIVEFTNRI